MVVKASRTTRSRSMSSSTSGSTRPAPEARHGGLEQARDAREVEAAVEEPRDGDLVGRDQGGRCPRAQAAGVAGDPEGREARLVGRPEVEPAGGDQVRRGGGRRATVGVGQRVLDGKSHVGGAQLGLQRAVHEPDGGVDDALGVDDHLDRVVADIVQPVCLDDLQALVGERRGVDRDLGAHRPGRVAQGLRGRDRGHLRGRRVEERPARRGQDERLHAGHVLADEALPDRRVLRVDRPEPGQRARVWVAGSFRATARARSPASGMTRWPPATRVSLLAVATTLPARSAARTGRRLTTPPVATMTRSTSSRVASVSSASAPPDEPRAARQVQAGRGGPRRPAPRRRVGVARPGRPEAQRWSPSPGRPPGTRRAGLPARRSSGARSSRSSRAARPGAAVAPLPARP